MNTNKKAFLAQNAIASFYLEGEKPTPELLKLLDEYVEGKIELEELEKRIRQRS